MLRAEVIQHPESPSPHLQSLLLNLEESCKLTHNEEGTPYPIQPCPGQRVIPLGQ